MNNLSRSCRLAFAAECEFDEKKYNTFSAQEIMVVSSDAEFFSKQKKTPTRRFGFTCVRPSEFPRPKILINQTEMTMAAGSVGAQLSNSDPRARADQQREQCALEKKKRAFSALDECSLTFKDAHV